MRENDTDEIVEHRIPTVDIHMIIGMFALGYGLYKWTGAGIASILSAIFLMHFDDDNNTDK